MAKLSLREELATVPNYNSLIVAQRSCTRVVRHAIRTDSALDLAKGTDFTWSRSGEI